MMIAGILQWIGENPGWFAFWLVALFAAAIVLTHILAAHRAFNEGMALSDHLNRYRDRQEYERGYADATQGRAMRRPSLASQADVEEAAHV